MLAQPFWAICISQCFVASVCHQPPLADIGPPRKPRWILKDLFCPHESIFEGMLAQPLGNLHITTFCRFSLPPAAIDRHWPAKKYFKEASLDPQRPVLSTRVDLKACWHNHFGQFAYHMGNLHIRMFCRFSLQQAAIDRFAGSSK